MMNNYNKKITVALYYNTDSRYQYCDLHLIKNLSLSILFECTARNPSIAHLRKDHHRWHK